MEIPIPRSWCKGESSSICSSSVVHAAVSPSPTAPTLTEEEEAAEEGEEEEANRPKDASRKRAGRGRCSYRIQTDFCIGNSKRPRGLPSCESCGLEVWVVWSYEWIVSVLRRGGRGNVRQNKMSVAIANNSA